MKLKNPILPFGEYVPDVEAHTMPDGRLYLYGSYDEKMGQWCSEKYKVFSTSDMESIMDHGVSFNLSQLNNPKAAKLFAPDAIEKDGKYFLYSCCNDGSEWIAVSDKPEGPFEDASRVEGALGIDPAVFVDDDGQAYLYWGQFSLNGAKLSKDMRSIEKDSLKTDLINEKDHFFHEGSSMRKRNGIYYLSYASVARGENEQYGGVPTCIAYATSESPLGPFTYRGIIIDNVESDPNTWNNHGSIEEFNGQWYVFYHRPTRNSKHFRRCACEKIYFDENGLIQEVPMTSSGCNDYLDASGVILDATLVCGVKGGCYIIPKQDGKEEEIDGIKDGSSVVYRWIRFQGETGVEIFGTGKTEAEIWFECDGKSKLLCTVNFDGSKTSQAAGIEQIAGVGELKIIFKNPSDFKMDKIIFH